MDGWTANFTITVFSVILQVEMLHDCQNDYT